MYIADISPTEGVLVMIITKLWSMTESFCFICKTLLLDFQR